MFNKKPAIKEGPSFPFMDTDSKECRIRYDSLKLSFDGGYVTMTYMQDGVPIYAYTYSAGGDHDVTFEGMEGHIKIEMTPK